MGFSVFDVMGPESKAGIKEVPQARFRTKDISIFKMYRNEKKLLQHRSCGRIGRGNTYVRT